MIFIIDELLFQHKTDPNNIEPTSGFLNFCYVLPPVSPAVIQIQVLRTFSKP